MGADPTSQRDFGVEEPFYAGADAYGQSENRTAIVDGRARKTYGHHRPLDECEIFLNHHHESSIDWAEYERNQKQLATNAYSRRDGAKSGRGGRSLLIGLMICGRCERRLKVAYRGRYPYPVYQGAAETALGLPRCMCFAGQRVDAAVARELIRVVQPMAIQAALVAERVHMEGRREQRILELELQQARYEASLAERRSITVGPWPFAMTPDGDACNAPCVIVWRVGDANEVELLTRAVEIDFGENG